MKKVFVTIVINCVFFSLFLPGLSYSQEKNTLISSFPLAFWDFLYHNAYYHPITILTTNIDINEDEWKKKKTIGAYSNWHLRNYTTAIQLLSEIVENQDPSCYEAIYYNRKLEGWYLYSRKIKEYESLRFSSNLNYCNNNKYQDSYTLLINDSNDPLDLINLSIYGIFSRDITNAKKSLDRYLDIADSEHSNKAEVIQLQQKLGILPSRKSPLFAGFMSTIIPGSGALYSGRTWDAIYSLIIVGGFSALAAESMNNNGLRHPSTIILGGVGLSFHFGNIYGSYRRAIEYNEELFHDLDNASDHILNNNYHP